MKISARFAAGLVLVLLAGSCAQKTAAFRDPEAPRWQAIPAGPLQARSDAVAVAIGADVYVFGGSRAPACPPNADCIDPVVPALKSGARYDLNTRSWTSIAESPVGFRASYVSVARTEKRIWVLGIRDGSFFSYDPSANRWARHPSPPGKNLHRLLTSHGAAPVAYVTSHENVDARDAIFDPSAGRWRELPRDPLAPAFDRAVVSDGRSLTLLALPLVADPGVRPSLYKAAAYDPATASWKRLPDSEISGHNPEWFFAGDAIVNPWIGSVDGGETNNYGRSYPTGGIFDPARAAWRALPAAAATGTYRGALAAGDQIVVSRGAVLDVPGNRWLPLDAPGDVPDVASRAVTVAGDSVFAWGGSTGFGEATRFYSDGWLWTAR